MFFGLIALHVVLRWNLYLTAWMRLYLSVSAYAVRSQCACVCANAARLMQCYDSASTKYKQKKKVSVESKLYTFYEFTAPSTRHPDTFIHNDRKKMMMVWWWLVACCCCRLYCFCCTSTIVLGTVPPSYIRITYIIIFVSASCCCTTQSHKSDTYRLQRHRDTDAQETTTAVAKYVGKIAGFCVLPCYYTSCDRLEDTLWDRWNWHI